MGRDDGGIVPYGRGPIAGRGYLYPLIPWNGKALRSLLLRRPAHKDNT